MSVEPEKCVILVPHGGQIVRSCEAGLRELESRGYPVRRVPGFSAIDVARNQLATDAIRDGFEETMWIDSDTGFNPDAVDLLRSHNLPLVCGVYPKKNQRALAIHVMPGTKKIQFGRKGGLIEIMYAATGFLHVRRQVYEDVQQKLDLPECNQRFEKTVVPFFQPLIVEDGAGHWYLAEDYSFCERVRRAGYRVMADTRIRLWHVGEYSYGWEDAGRNVERFVDYAFHMPD